MTHKLPDKPSSPVLFSMFPTRLSLAASVAALTITFAGLALSAAKYPIRSDDAFITFRVARNLADGRGMVYNEGERRQVSSTPAYCLLLATTRVLTGCDIIDASRFWEFIFLAANALLLWWIVARAGFGQWAWIAPLLLATDPFITLLSKGMESAAVSAFILATLLSLGTGRLVTAAATLGAAVLTRFDGMILGGVVAVGTAVELTRRNAPPSVWARTLAIQGAVFFVIVLPWFITATVYFGAPLPVTIGYKMSQVSQLGLTPFGPAFLKSFFWNQRLGILDFRSIPFVLGLVAVLWIRTPRFWLGEWWILYLIVYSIAGMPFYLWYPFPLRSTAAAITAIGFGWTTRWAMQRRNIMHRIAIVLMATAGIGVAAQSLELTRFLWHEASLPADSEYRDTKSYAAIGRYLAEQSEPSAMAASFEVGLIGYYSDRPILDLVGLTSYVPAEDLRRNKLDLILSRKPEFVVIEDDVYQNFDPMKRKRFEEFYGVEIAFFDPMPQKDPNARKRVLLFSIRAQNQTER